jgi:hypothetical protein
MRVRNILCQLLRGYSGEENQLQDEPEQARAWSISAQLAALAPHYIEQVPSEVATLIRAAKDLHREMAAGAAHRASIG